VVLPDVVDLELDCDPLQGYARHVFAAEGFRGVHVIDVEDPTAPRRTQFVATVQPRDLAFAGEHLFVADGAGGLRVFDVGDDREAWSSESRRCRRFDARDVVLAVGRTPTSPTDRAACSSWMCATRRGPRSSAAEEQDEVGYVAALFQNSRPRVVEGVLQDRRTGARMLLAALDEREGLHLFDVTEPSAPLRLFPNADGTSRARRPKLSWRGLHLASHVDLAEAQGGASTRESDYVYALGESDANPANPVSNTLIYDVSEPRRTRLVGTVESGSSTEMLALGSFYNTPFLQTVGLVPGARGVTLVDATVSAAPKQAGALPAIRSAYVVALEQFPLDKMLDEADRALKDTSHVGSRWLRLSEIERLLLVPADLLGILGPQRPRVDPPGQTARLQFTQLDSDGSGILDGDEITPVIASSDADGDGRILLAELAGLAGLVAAPVSEASAASQSPILVTRVDRDGDLSRLVDGLDPLPFDANHDRKLDRAECSRAVFAALDLDGDGALDVDELSRHPGELRQLRYRGPWAKARMAQLDLNRKRHAPTARVHDSRARLRRARCESRRRRAAAAARQSLPRATRSARPRERVAHPAPAVFAAAADGVCGRAALALRREPRRQVDPARAQEARGPVRRLGCKRRWRGDPGRTGPARRARLGQRHRRRARSFRRALGPRRRRQGRTERTAAGRARAPRPLTELTARSTRLLDDLTRACAQAQRGRLHALDDRRATDGENALDGDLRVAHVLRARALVHLDVDPLVRARHRPEAAGGIVAHEHEVQHASLLDAPWDHPTLDARVHAVEAADALGEHARWQLGPLARLDGGRECVAFF
jgi:hypothetical protein